MLLRAKFDSVGTTPAINEISYDNLVSNKTISFTANGVGEASLVLGVRFLPLVPNTRPIYRGISVEKVIQPINVTSGKTGTATTNGTIGNFVKVTIQIIVPDDSSAIDIVDPLSGCIEALDDSFSNRNGRLPPVPQDSVGFVIFDPFAFREYFFDKVVFHGQGVRAGTHTVSYVGLITSPGSFFIPSALAFDVQQPELLGLSASSTFEV